MPVSVWIKAARLRTLPLATAGAVTGNLMAMVETGKLDKPTFVLSILTAIFLQVLSNYANDYGDFINGADTDERTDRVMASGLITEQKMRNALTILILLTLSSGISLLTYNYIYFNSSFIWMFLIGIAGILAAYFYTAGKKPYGYVGLGDLAVFLFFGLVAVPGTYYLQTASVSSNIWWIACGVGLLSVAVLNVNNMRDIVTDRSKNKITVPVIIGYRKAVLYHALLLITALGCLGFYIYREYHHPLQMTCFILIPLFLKHFYNILKASKEGRAAYNKQLKALSMLTLMLCLIFCFSHIFIQ